MGSCNTRPELYSRESIPFGKAWQNWPEIWWKWCLKDLKGISAAEDVIGELCNKNQNDPDVWFLAGTFGGKAERNCEIPEGRAVFFPVVNDLISYAEYSGLETEEQLCTYAKEDLDTATQYEVIVDNIILEGLENYRIRSDLFNIVVPMRTEIGITTTSTMAVSDGYWIFLKPLCVGSHLIYFKGEKSLYDGIQDPGYRGENGRFKVEVTYHVTVR